MQLHVLTQAAIVCDWCRLGYEGNKLAVAGKGDGGLQEMLSKV